MPLTDVAPIEATIDIAAPPEVVWALVSDLRNMARWSPQTVRSIPRRGESGLGTHYLNINRKGLLVWPTRTKVVRYDEGREIAWRVKDNFTVWSIRLEPTDAGTRVLQTREAPDGISDISVNLTRVAFGGVPRFTEVLQDGMARTLTRIKADAEERARLGDC